MIINMCLSYVDWVELESLVSQQRTVVHIKCLILEHIIMGLSYVEWVEHKGYGSCH